MALETSMTPVTCDVGERSLSHCAAIVPAYRRIDQLLATLTRLQGCIPAPAETIVHVDGNQTQCAAAITEAFPSVRLIISQGNVGPGGGRNKLIEAATCPIVASFDDDSYPLDGDYFARVETLFSRIPDAAILAAAIYHRGESTQPADKHAKWTADFVGCGCAYRREVFQKLGGYVPLPIAYGMEESDLALRLHGSGGKILYTPWLRIFHDTNRKDHASSEITSASVANIALLAFLRYPVSLLPIGACQVANRVLWLLKNKRYKGIGSGLLRIPAHLIANLSYRKPQSLASIRSYRRLRRAPQDVHLDL